MAVLRPMAPSCVLFVLALASLLQEATSQQITAGLDTAGSWLQLLAQVVRDQTRRGTSNTLILALRRGWTSPHDPVMDAVERTEGTEGAIQMLTEDRRGRPKGPPRRTERGKKGPRRQEGKKGPPIFF
ncbi:hypothetical protein CA13_63510 [Planctomycetes bacterium CA13]|uniref:Uncharacterized protein n=1 Tax=Novipirellula herctigrandis TaxID=2527986 RepID=A0A5C5ZCH2_9BACT|nr:hypothetical protein CA13_63510 [Planctomycetes bacterium CA13]